MNNLNSTGVVDVAVALFAKEKYRLSRLVYNGLLFIVYNRK
jgi:hypothetical protein